MAYFRKNDWVKVKNNSPYKGMIGEITQVLGKGSSYVVAIDEINQFVMLQEDELEYVGRL